MIVMPDGAEHLVVDGHVLIGGSAQACDEAPPR